MEPILANVSRSIDQLTANPSFPLYAAAAGIFVAIAVFTMLALRWWSRFAVRPTTNIVVGDVDTLAVRLAEAEKIGHFGSFSWDFENPQESYWSEEMFLLLDLVFARHPPAPEEFFAFAHAGDRARVQAEWKKACITSGPFSFAFRALTKSGRHIHLQVTGKTVKGSGMAPKIIQGVAHDITKEMEVDRAKSEFVSLASHQLKTPITSIRWLSEALQRGSLGKLLPEQEKYVAGMHEASERMVALINDILNVSRIETDTLAIRPEPFDVCELAKSVLDEQRHTAEEKKLSLTLIAAPEMPIVHMDKQLVRMLFQNLFSNAIKYTPEHGTVSCEISLAKAVRETIFVKIQDTGIGIPKAEQSRVFEKLHRASNALASVPDGTGLGLYLVKTIIDKVGGGITFESIEGKGTTFFVSIPVVWKASGEKALT